MVHSSVSISTRLSAAALSASSKLIFASLSIRSPAYHVPPPVILRHVSQSSVDTALSCDSVRSGGEEFRDDGRVESGLCETHSGTKTGTTGADDQSIVLVVNDRVCLRRGVL